MTIKLSTVAREYLAIPAPLIPDAARPAELARLNEERDAAYTAFCAALASAKTQTQE